MRIAHVITRMIIGGAQENTLLNCLDLKSLFGDDVLLVTGPAFGPEGDLLDRQQGSGLRVTMINSLRREIHPLRDWQALRAIKATLRAFHPEVVHTHSAKGGFLGRLAASSLRIPAIVHTVHGAPFHNFQGRGARLFFRQCEKYAAGKCHALISVADAMTDSLVAAQVAPRDKFTTIYSGMKVEPFLHANVHRDSMRQRFGFKTTDVVIGKVARLFHLKGHKYLIEAARKVVTQCPNTHFLLVGDGILREPLAAQIAAANLDAHFHFAGLVDPDEIPAFIGAMDILVHTSLREGLARTLPQALIAGKPVVSYDIDGAREVVVPHETGFLLQPQSQDGLSEALIQLSENGELRNQFGQTGCKRVAPQFCHQHMTKRIRSLYQQILADQPK
ncbi:MAG: glycosyltransferase family 4 protein [Pirellulaceae bacterium]|nr:glycosyltransferase family 4 protein [Pirellulaceae bacterium]